MADEPSIYLTQDDLELMVTFAHQVAIALDNASAYQQIEELNAGLEAKVQERTRELEQADRLRSQFLSHVSHELKTPMTSIKGFLQNMLDGLTGSINEKQQRYMSRMLENSERLIRMTCWTGREFRLASLNWLLSNWILANAWPM